MKSRKVAKLTFLIKLRNNFFMWHIKNSEVFNQRRQCVSQVSVIFRPEEFFQLFRSGGLVFLYEVDFMSLK